MVLPSKQHCLHLEPVDRPAQRLMLQTRWQRVVRFAAEGSLAEAFGAGKDPFDTAFSAVGRLLLAPPKALIGLQQMGLNQRQIMLGSSSKNDSHGDSLIAASSPSAWTLSSKPSWSKRCRR